VKDLKKRVSQRERCACFNAAARQLWLCYEIGFGVKRNNQEALQWLTRCSDSFDPVEELQRIDTKYNPSEPARLDEALGYEVNLPFDPVELYRTQNRVSQAEAAFRMEVDGRKESFGDTGKSHLSQLSTLSLILAEQGKLDEAVQTSRAAAAAYTTLYGQSDLQTISAMNYLSSLLFTAGELEELESLQIELIKIKEEHEEIGPTDHTTLNSKNNLAAVYCLQGRYGDCLSLASELVSLRTEILGEEHFATLTSKTWVIRARLEMGDLDGLIDESKRLVEGSIKLNGDHHQSTLQAKEMHAAVLLGSSVPESGASIDRDLLDESQATIRNVLEIIDPEESEDGDIEDEESDTTQASNIRDGKDGTLFLRSRTTLACILALQDDLKGAEAELQYTEEALSAKKYLHEIEWKRLEQVKTDVSTLTQLARNSQGQEEPHSTESITRRLAHRWINNGTG
jgi:tetratricopeptide repeat protein